EPGILGAKLHADGSHAKLLCVPGTVAGGQVAGRPLVHMDGGAVFKFAVTVLDQVVGEILADTGIAISQVDWLVPHQANIRIIQATAKRLRLLKEALGLDRPPTS